ncbi:MAG: hypothetical protein IJK86_08480 [Lachnospiraceae bacterium]|nr:hypothetical protein [Lachnospiraceae bacterium]
MMTTVFKRMLRRPGLSLAGLVLAAALCFILCFLVRYRDLQAAQLEEIRNGYAVRGVVTDARGTKSNNLCLNRMWLEFILDEEKGLAPYITDVRLIKNLESQSELGRALAVGVSSPQTDKRLDVSLDGGYHCEREDFFETKDFCCLVPETVYEKYAGGQIACMLTNPYTSAGLGSVGDNNGMEFKLDVVGWYKGDGTDVILPFPAAQRLGGRLTNTISVDAISFALKDNSQADLVREIAAKEFIQPDPSSLSFRPGLTIQDRQYRAALTEMEQNIRRTERLLPVCAFLSLAAGFFMGFLSVRGETKTYALMRTLGVGAGRLTGMVLLEQLLLPAAGTLAIGLIMGQLLPALVYFACHAVGCLLAVLRPALAAPTKLLRVQE